MDDSLFAAFKRYAVGLPDAQKTGSFPVTAILQLLTAPYEDSAMFEQEATDSKNIEVARCYAVHKDYLQETLMRTLKNIGMLSSCKGRRCGCICNRIFLLGKK